MGKSFINGPLSIAFSGNLGEDCFLPKKLGKKVNHKVDQQVFPGSPKHDLALSSWHIICILYIIYWLVVSTPLKNSSSWDYYSQYMEKCSKPPTSYICIHIVCFHFIVSICAGVKKMGFCCFAVIQPMPWESKHSGYINHYKYKSL